MPTTTTQAATPYASITPLAGAQQQASRKDAVDNTFLDMINPLQHVPVVSSVYRAITGDEASIVARTAGGAMYGGGVLGALGGLAGSVVDSAAEAILGDSPVHAMATMFTVQEQQALFSAPAAASLQAHDARYTYIGAHVVAQEPATIAATAVTQAAPTQQTEAIATLNEQAPVALGLEDVRKQHQVDDHLLQTAIRMGA